ncbi:multidrug effflux MFS transporter [Peteryoungia desertarenae]|uniref:Bcr/CflA family efflux transporter n=1 Tax=Peteryoungia desertarenae TaxID=1813451 RepID=A0ABX6QJE6_9HYPH|nr:multidrug effflux MFS transporter [Peteryoungia desertarenae]QLF68683.1 multidrug effflux MFS transporter [Peteryoungia desertarenae]
MSQALMSERRTAFIGALLTTLGPISMAIYTPAMPQLVEAFGTTESAIKMSLSLFFAGFAVAQLAAGPLSDGIGRRNATLGFLLIYLFGSVVASLATTVEWLLAGRLIQGVGASVGVTVSRAIVRDQFTGPEAARILNLIGIMLAIGPAAGPTLGGLALVTAGWQAVFLLMVGFGLLSAVAVLLFLKETTKPDPALMKPKALAIAYSMLATDPRVLLPAFVLAGCVGALYAQATMLPFILIDRVGLTPPEFGIGMLMQSGFFFSGSLALRLLANRLGETGALRLGLWLAGGGGVIIAISTRLIEPTFLSIMGPVAVCSFGIAFVIPYITTAGLQPYPQIAGSAAALIGFIQMASGFLGGLSASVIGDPLAAFGTVIPIMEVSAVIAYLLHRKVARSTT